MIWLDGGHSSHGRRGPEAIGGSPGSWPRAGDLRRIAVQPRSSPMRALPATCSLLEHRHSFRELRWGALWPVWRMTLNNSMTSVGR